MFMIVYGDYRDPLLKIVILLVVTITGTAKKTNYVQQQLIPPTAARTVSTLSTVDKSLTG